jgi:hypothetical protein
MGLPRNWEKIEDSAMEEIWFNRVTSMQLSLEKTEGENYVYERFQHPGLDGTDIPGSPFDRQDEAREEAIDYMQDHAGPDQNVEAASTLLERMHPGNPLEMPRLETHVEGDHIWFSINTYYFLNGLLERDEMCLMVDEMMERYRKQQGGAIGTETMVKISHSDKVVNTFNAADAHELTSTISYVFADFQRWGRPEPVDEIYDAEYVILRLHKGGDVRGNYTSPRCFKLGEHIEATRMISDLHNVSATVEGEDGEEILWYSDDGGHNWYEGDGSGTEKWRFDEDNDEVYYKPSGQKIRFTARAVDN